MSKPLLSLPATSRQFRRLLGTAAGFALALAAPAVAQAQTIFGLSGTDLTSVNLASPFTSQTRVAITGVAAGQTLVGIDFRPATGELYALGYDASVVSPTNNANLYVINQTTAVATAVGAAMRLNLGGSTERIAFDFNPTVDRIRVAGTNDANYRLHPTTGAVTVDGALAFVAGDPNTGQNPYVGAAAYTNSFIGAAATTLYYIDEQRSLLLRSDTPNGGTLATVVALNPQAAGNATPINAPGASTDLDIFTFGPNDQQYYLSVNQVQGGQFASFFYRLDPATGATTFAGAFNGTGVGITDIAIRINRTAPAVSGRLLYALNTNNTLVSFYSGTPQYINSAVALSGVTAGQTLVGTDFRPNTGQLIGMGYDPNTAGANAQFYVIDPATGLATPLAGAVRLELGSDINGIGFDFNPTVDRIRVTGRNRNNYRINPNNAAGAPTVDGALNFVDGTPGTPNVGAVAYTNSYPGSTSTTLYDLEENLNRLFIQSNPNLGQLTGVSMNPTLPTSGAINDLDIFFDAAAQTNQAFVVSNSDATTTTATYSSLYTLNLATGQTTLTGPIGLGVAVRDVSAQLAGANASAQLTGRLLYGVAGGNLVSFDSGNPTVIRTAVNITGLPADGSQVLAGADFRPATGELFALGYNAATQQGQLYTVNLTSGALTAVGSLNSMALGATASAIGFDFNPTVDLIRVTSGTNQANLRVSPTTGAVTTDTGLTNPSGAPVMTGAAYTNNDNNANTGTTLYGIDQARSVLLRSTNANGGTYVDQGSLGVTLNATLDADFDIYSDLSNASAPGNSAFLAAANSGSSTDNLYTVDLTSGTASLTGRIGSGSNLTGLAAFLTPGPVIAAGLTWTGAVSTDWGTAGNWSPAQVPTATDNVTIPDVANDPVVNGSQQANGVVLGTGATLTLTDGSGLNVSGNFTNNSGTVLSSGPDLTGQFNMAGGSISGTLSVFPNLIISSFTTINGPVSVRRLLGVAGQGATLTIPAGQVLTLLSDATGTACVEPSSGTVFSNIIGNVTVQRYIEPSLNPGAGYRHFSSPVANATVGGLATAGFTPVVNPAYNTAGNSVQTFPNVFGYDELRVNTSGGAGSTDFDKGWFSPSSLADRLEVTRGYAVNISAAATVSFTGPLNDVGTGGAFMTVPDLTRGTQTESGWHLRGNPYPAPIDWDRMVAGGFLSRVDNGLYVFKSSGQYTGTYASYVNGVGANGGTNVVPVAQGFFVRTSSAPRPGPAIITFTGGVRIRNYNTPFQRNAADTRPMLTLALGNATARTQAIVYMETGATAGFDGVFDASFLPGSNGLTLALEAGAERLAISGLPVPTGADVVAPLHVAAATAGTYNLQVDNLANLPAGYFAYLRDGLTGTYTSLTPGTSIPLTLAANAAAGGRYAVVFTTQARVLATAPAALAKLASVFPNPAHGTATLLLPVALRGQQATVVTVADNLGRTVLTRTLAAGTAESLELPLAGLAPGVYSVQARTAAGLVAKRLVVE